MKMYKKRGYTFIWGVLRKGYSVQYMKNFRRRFWSLIWFSCQLFVWLHYIVYNVYYTVRYLLRHLNKHFWCLEEYTNGNGIWWNLIVKGLNLLKNFLACEFSAQSPCMQYCWKTGKELLRRKKWLNITYSHSNLLTFPLLALRPTLTIDSMILVITSISSAVFTLSSEINFDVFWATSSTLLTSTLTWNKKERIWQNISNKIIGIDFVIYVGSLRMISAQIYDYME